MSPSSSAKPSLQGRVLVFGALVGVVTFEEGVTALTASALALVIDEGTADVASLARPIVEELGALVDAILEVESEANPFRRIRREFPIELGPIFVVGLAWLGLRALSTFRTGTKTRSIPGSSIDVSLGQVGVEPSSTDD